MIIDMLRINGLENPIGYLYDPPLLSWKVRESRGTHATDICITVSDNEAFTQPLLEKRGTNLQNTGERLELALLPYTRYYVRVAVTSDANETAQNTCFFETGKLNEEWEAKWIGVKDDFIGNPEFRNTFTAPTEIVSARLYICGLGLFEAWLNGEKVGDDLLAPFVNDYKEHVQSCAYDVTALIHSENDLRVLLGDGWYKGAFGLNTHMNDGKKFALIAELRIICKDGSLRTICTDEEWQYRPSLIEMSGLYEGETQNWQRDESFADKAVAAAAPARLIDRYSLPLHAMEQLAVAQIIHTPKGETVLDFGQNFAGYVQCTQYIPGGERMILEFGEIIQDGCFYHENYRTAKSVFTYISDGIQRTIRPYFTFFGFRYVKVSGIVPDCACFTGRAIYSQMDRCGWLETGHYKINRLHENTLWGLKSNFVDMPTDCPQRDERVGWTGDAQVFCQTASYLMDTRAFYDKYCRDLHSDQQRNDGRVAIYLPNEFPGLCAAVWSDIATFLPMILYRTYGCKERLIQQFPMMREWVDAVRAMDRARGEKHLWDFGFQFGDWLALDGATEQSTFGRTDKYFISSVYYYASASYVAQAASILGYAQEAEEYSNLASEIKAAIEAEYFSVNGRLTIDTQTGYLIALRFGLGQNRQRLREDLKQRIFRDCRRIKGGFVGATMMNTVLADFAMSSLAYDFLLYEGFPGWLYAVNLGATTIWERWNSVLPDGSISGSGMNSLNHYSYGAVTEFLYKHTAGIQPLSPGFGRARIAPLPDVRLKFVSCRFDSPHGAYVSEWRIEKNGSLSFHIEIPFGCEAEIVLPEQPTLTVHAGVYDYVIKTKRDYLAPYDGDTAVEWLLEDSAAVEAIERSLPGWSAGVNRADAEAMSQTLNDARARAARFRTSTQAIDQAIEALQAVHIQV